MDAVPIRAAPRLEPPENVLELARKLVREIEAGRVLALAFCTYDTNEECTEAWPSARALETWRSSLPRNPQGDVRTRQHPGVEE